MQPHGFNIHCNYYCTDVEHAVVILGEKCDVDGFPTTPESIIAGSSAYYADQGWLPIRAKRIEADPEVIMATFSQDNVGGPVRIDPYDSREHPVPAYLHLMKNYEPWLVIFIPLKTSTGE